MNSPPGKDQFAKDVYPSELRSIIARRVAAKLPEASSTNFKKVIEAADNAQDDDEKGVIHPDVSHGTIGLAFSGGGIRSATLNLGILQGFAEKGLIKWFDYLSTVSGGGYIGSTLSTILNFKDKDANPGSSLLREGREADSKTVKHLRSGGNYLAPNGILDILRIPAILFKGIVLNLLVLTPTIILFVLYSGYKFPDINNLSFDPDTFYMSYYALYIFGIWIVLFPIFAFAIRHPNYTLRSLYEKSFSIILFLAIVIPVFESLPWIYTQFFLNSSGSAKEGIIGGLIGGLSVMFKLIKSLKSSNNSSKFKEKLYYYIKLIFLGLLGPAILFLIYSFIMNWLYNDIGFIVIERIDYLILYAIFIYFFTRMFININRTGMHRFYRDRLSKVYLFNPFSKNRSSHSDKLKISELNIVKSGAPYHILNATLNVPATKDPDLRGRKSDFFSFGFKWSGSNQTGYIRTEQLEKVEPDLNLGTAMAISGAAASPFMGGKINKFLSFLLTILNIRLDYWIVNPLKISNNSFMRWIKTHFYWPGTKYLLMELFGNLNAQKYFVNLSDGGHIENLGLYELLKRKCKYIICSDAGEDSAMTLDSLVRLMVYAQIDMGISFEWDDFELFKNDESGMSKTHFIQGTIYYGPKDEDKGKIIYIKSSLKANDPKNILAYKNDHPKYPHQSTADQFFDDFQFEAYRSLGNHIATELLKINGSPEEKFGEWFNELTDQIKTENGSLTKV